ncbi:MAG: DNA (cytosine-5-)-methyltransferase [Ferruginibacter sp.]
MEHTNQYIASEISSFVYDPKQLTIFEKESEMNSTDSLKYPRRVTRKIANVVYKLNSPSEVVSMTMKKIPSSNTKIEKIIEQELILNNISYTTSNLLIENIDGKPDFVLPRYRIAIFCDGEFWHGKDFDKMKIKNNAEFWTGKIERNILRDEQVNYGLNKKEWKVFRFWENEIKENSQKCIDKVKQYISKVEEDQKFKFTFVDLFAGIGGFRIPLEELGGKCLGFSEIDRHAIETYRTNFLGFKNSDEIELGSITNLEKLPFPKIDLIVGGVPCQAWSVAGKMRGFDDPRGKLWNDTLRVVKLNKPKAFIFENVKGLIDPRNKESLQLIVESFEDAGYFVKFKLLNSYDFGLPQNRDRIFIVGINKKYGVKNSFKFPLPQNKKSFLNEIINGIDSNDPTYKKEIIDPKQLFGDKIPMSRNRFQKLNEFNDFFIFCDTRNGHTTIHSWDIIRTSKREKEICMTILKNRRKSIYGSSDGNPLSFKDLKALIPKLKESELKHLISKKILKFQADEGYVFVNSKNSAGINGIYRIYLPQSNIFSTLTATGTKDMVALKNIHAKTPHEYKEKFIEEIIKSKKYRPITANEAGKLQGFPKWFAVHKNEKLAKKQFGNAVSTSVIYNLGVQLLKTDIFKNDQTREISNLREI